MCFSPLVEYAPLNPLQFVKACCNRHGSVTPGGVDSCLGKNQHSGIFLTTRVRWLDTQVGTDDFVRKIPDCSVSNASAICENGKSARNSTGEGQFLFD